MPALRASLGPEQVALRILALSDVHGALMPEDMMTGRSNPGSGLSRAALLLQQNRAEAENHLTFDCGDFLQGGPLADCAMAEVDETHHPIIAVMNALEIDAAAIGNHELDYGPEKLAKALSWANFPALAANLVALGDAPKFQATALLERKVRDGRGKTHQLKIGVIGLLPPQVSVWNRDQMKDRYQTHGIPDVARLSAKSLRAAGADLVVALCHSGIDDETARSTAENAAIAVAKLSEVDVVICGHTHRVFPGQDHAPTSLVDPVKGTLAGKPAVMPGAYASHVGRVDLIIERKSGVWRILQKTVAALPVTDLPDGAQDARVEAIAKPVLQRLQKDLCAEIATTDVALHSCFAPAGASTALALIAVAQADYVANKLHGSKWENVPLVSAVAPLGAQVTGNGSGTPFIQPGPITRSHLYDLYPFPNAIKALLMTGAQLRACIQSAQMNYGQLEPSKRKQLLLNPSRPQYYLDAFYGLDYELDLTQPPTSEARLGKIRYQGKTLSSRSRVVVAVSSYRAAIWLSRGMARDVILDDTTLVRSVLEAYLRDRTTITAESLPASPMRFKPIEDCSAGFHLPPDAVALRSYAKASNIRIGKADKSGHLRARLHFCGI